MSCNHCANPPCLPACPYGAISKWKEDGIVVVDSEKCVACRSCEKKCPYGSPQFRAGEAKMEKCDFCLERLASNLAPICIAGCPVLALDAGPLEELRRQHGNLRMVEGLADPSRTEPAILFKPKI